MNYTKDNKGTEYDEAKIFTEFLRMVHSSSLSKKENDFRMPNNNVNNNMNRMITNNIPTNNINSNSPICKRSLWALEVEENATNNLVKTSINTIANAQENKVIQNNKNINNYDNTGYINNSANCRLINEIPENRLKHMKIHDNSKVSDNIETFDKVNNVIYSKNSEYLKYKRSASFAGSFENRNEFYLNDQESIPACTVGTRIPIPTYNMSTFNNTQHRINNKFNNKFNNAFDNTVFDSNYSYIQQSHMMKYNAPRSNNMHTRHRFMSVDESFSNLRNPRMESLEYAETEEGFICAYCEAKYVYKRCLINHLLKSHKKLMKRV